MIKNILSFDWQLWFYWILATTLGWIFGGTLFTGLSSIGSGFLIGIFQWLVLLGRFPRSWRWLPATTLGWLCGYLLVIVIDKPEFGILNGAVLGLAVGFAQWITLRNIFHWAILWIFLSGMAWITGFSLMPGVLSTGSLAGAISGLAMELLLRNPLPAKAR